MKEGVELRYNRHGYNLKKKSSKQKSNNQQTGFTADRFPLKSFKDKTKTHNYSGHRLSLLFKNIDDDISEVAVSKRNSLISNASSWAYRPPISNNELTTKEKSLRSVAKRPSEANLNQQVISFNDYQNLNINESRFVNPTENNLDLSDMNEQVNKNNQNVSADRNSRMSINGDVDIGPSYYEQYDDQAEYQNEKINTDISPISRVRDNRGNRNTNFSNGLTSNDNLSAEEIGNLNKNYLDDMNIQLTPPNKNRLQATKQSLEKNGLDSFVEDDRYIPSSVNKIEDSVVEVNTDDIDGEWSTKGDEYIQSKRYLELIKREKLNLKDPVDQIDDPGDHEFDVKKYKENSNTKEDQYVTDDRNVSKNQQESDLWDETNELIRENNDAFSGSEYDSRNSFSESDSNDSADEDFMPSESDQTPITTQRRLRKSSRIKVPTLDFWRNERIIYKKDPNGPGLTIDDVIKIDKDKEVHEDDFIKKKKGQSSINTVGQGKKKRGRKKKIANNLGFVSNLNHKIYEKIDAGEIPGSDWLKFGIFETEVQEEHNDNMQDMVVAFAPDTASETVATLTSLDDFTICFTLEKALSESDMIKTGFLKFPIETGRKSKHKNACKWLQFIVLNGVVEVKLYHNDDQRAKEDIMVCVKNSEFLIPTGAYYSLENIGEDELQLNFTMIVTENGGMGVGIEDIIVADGQSNELSSDEEQLELSKFLDGDGEEKSIFDLKENDIDGIEKPKQLFIESSDALSTKEE